MPRWRRHGRNVLTREGPAAELDDEARAEAGTSLARRTAGRPRVPPGRAMSGEYLLLYRVPREPIREHASC